MISPGYLTDHVDARLTSPLGTRPDGRARI